MLQAAALLPASRQNVPGIRLRSGLSGLRELHKASVSVV